MNVRFFSYLVLSALFVSLFACNNGSKPSVTAVVAEEVVVPSTVDVSDYAIIYHQNCAACHQTSGEGLSGIFPELKGVDFLKGDKAEIINIALNGSSKPITVNGVVYPGGVMKVDGLSDKEGADVINYILNSWGNNFGTVSESEVAAAR